MSLLIDRLPDAVEISGVDYRINTGFRTAVLFELMMQDDFFYPAEKQDMALKLFFPVCPDDVNAAMRAIIWFYEGGDRKKNSRELRKRRGNHRLIYSYDHDDQYIYAAFLQQYGIDLTSAKLHWWQFRALFLALDDTCKFCKIMHYRAMTIDPKLSKEEQRFYRDMKEIYALPIDDDEQQKHDAIEAALMGDGDLTGLL